MTSNLVARYRPITVEGRGPTMRPYPDGEYVLWDDVKHLLERPAPETGCAEKALANLLHAIWQHETATMLPLSGGPLKAEVDAAMKLLGLPPKAAATAETPDDLVLAKQWLRDWREHLSEQAYRELESIVGDPFDGTTASGKTPVTASASTGDNAPPSRSLPSPVECPKCRTELAFEGDVCGLCNPEVQP
jgi:hypothetical protein